MLGSAGCAVSQSAGSGLLGWFADGTPRPRGLIVAASGLATAAAAFGLVRKPSRRL